MSFEQIPVLVGEFVKRMVARSAAERITSYLCRVKWVVLPGTQPVETLLVSRTAHTHRRIRYIATFRLIAI